MKARLIGMRKEMRKQLNRRERDISTEASREEVFNRKVAEAAIKIEAFEAELNKQVDSGKLTKEEFNKKLLEYSSKVFPSRGGKGQ